MSMQTILSARTLCALPALLLVALSANAAPLGYDVVVSESDVSAFTSLTANVDANPDFLNTFPQSMNMVGTSNTQPGSASFATADVGLPGNFDDGANGITFSDLFINLPSIADTVGIGQISVPLSVTGSPSQLIGFRATFSSFQITLNDSFSSTLTPSGNPNEWLWAGLADVTISGVLFPSVVIPDDSVPNVELDPTPFSQAATIPLAGTFSGDQSSTRVTVGFPVDGIDDLDLSLPMVDETFDLLDLGLVTLDVNFRDLILAELTGAVVFENDTLPIPEPGTASLLALGIAGLAAAGRRRV